MNIHKCTIIKSALKDICLDMGEPRSRHLSIARTAIEDAVLRIDCHIRLTDTQPIVEKQPPPERAKEPIVETHTPPERVKKPIVEKQPPPERVKKPAVMKPLPNIPPLPPRVKPTPPLAPIEDLLED